MNTNKSSEESSGGRVERRRFLLAGAAGIATTIAGCGEDGRSSSGQLAETTSHDSETPTVEPPDTTAATFQRADGSYEFDFEDLIEYEGWQWHDSSSEGYYHPDSRLFLVEVSEDTIHLTLENGHIKRDLAVSVEFNVAGGGTRSTETKTIETSDGFATHELSFDIDEFDLPELAPGYARPIADDTHEGATVTRLLKVHRYIAIPYDNADGSGIHYLNSEDGLNHQAYYHLDKEFIVNHMPRGQARHEIDTADDRTIFLAAVHGGKAIGGSTKINKQDVRDYETAESRPRRFFFPTVVYNAPNLDRYSILAQQFGRSLENAGITGQFAKLNALGIFVQTIPYQRGGTDSPIITLYENQGDCDEKTFLYMALAKCEPFDTRTAEILGELEGLGSHAVVGIDERDLGNTPDDRDIHYVEHENPPDCFPDVRHAYLELTSRNPIGRTSRLMEITGVGFTSDLTCLPQFRP